MGSLLYFVHSERCHFSFDVWHRSMWIVPQIVLSISSDVTAGRNRNCLVGTKLKGLFTVSICINDYNVANKWVPLICMVLFTSSDTKHQRIKSRIQRQTFTGTIAYSRTDVQCNTHTCMRRLNVVFEQSNLRLLTGQWVRRPIICWEIWHTWSWISYRRYLLI